MSDPERSKFWASDAEEENGGNGGDACTTASPLAYGNDNIGANQVTKYLDPAGSWSGGAAGIIPLPYIVQATSKVLRFQIRVTAGQGNGLDVEYEAMRLVAGVPTSFPAPMIIVLPSTFTGVAAIAVAGGNALADGDQVIIEVRKLVGGIGASPNCVQGFLQIENECGGGPPSVGCCAPQYLSQQMHQAFAHVYTTAAGGLIDLDASVCGQDEPITAVIRASALFPPATPPAVTGVAYIPPPTNILRVAWDNTGTDGNFVLEITNACGCCYVHPLEGVGA
jgi:hypothetical protein